MANRFEPKTTITRVDSSVSATINQTRATTYIGIEADTGRYDLQEVNSSKQLVEKYSTKSKPSKADGITLLHAGKFMEQFSGHVKRVNKDTVHPGIDSLNNTLYFDKNYNLIEDLTKITIQTNEKNLNEQPLILKVTYEDGTVKYFANDIGSENKSQYGVEDVIVIRSVDREGNAIQIVSSDVFIDTLANGGKEYDDGAYVSFSGRKYFPLDEVYYVKKSASIEIYGSIKIENVVGFELTSNSNSLLYVLKLDETSTAIGSQNIKCVLTTEDPTAIEMDNSYIRYADTVYAPFGSNGTGIKTIIAKNDDGMLEIKNYRDALTSALESIYEGSNAPISYINEDFVLQYGSDSDPQAACIFYKEIDDQHDITFTTGVSKSLKSIIPNIYFRSAQGVNWELIPSWDEVSTQDETTPQTATQAIKYNIEGRIEEVKSGWVAIYKAVENGNNELSKARYLFYFGYDDDSSAIAAYKAETGVDYLPDNEFEAHNISSPNALNLNVNVIPRLAIKASEVDEKFFEQTKRADALTGDVYNNSTVTKFEVYVPAVDAGYSGYQWNNNSTLAKKTNVRYTTNIALQANNMELSREDGCYWLTLNEYTFYNGTLPSTTITGTGVKVAAGKLTPEEFISLVKDKIRDYYATCGILSTGDIFIGTHAGTVSESCGINNDSSSAKVFNINIVEGTQSTTAKFALVQKFTSSGKLSKFSIEFDKNDPEIIYLENTYAFTSNNDTISFVEDKVDGYGVNLYYDKYNYLDRDFHIELLNVDGEIQEFTSAAFGNEVLPKKASIQDFIDALDDLEDVGFKPLFMYDAGLTDNNYYKAMAAFAGKYHAMVPATVPAYLIKNGRKYAYTLEQVKAFKNSMGNSTNRFVAEGWQRDVVFGDISFDCSPTYYYLQKVLSNTNAVTVEFQPIFWKMQGRIETSDPINKIRPKGEREELLDLNVNSIIRDLDAGYSYYNLNYTDQVVESDFSEEQNVRISNKIAHIADDYIDLNVMGKNHTTPLRKRVQDALSGLIQSGIIDNRGEDTANSFRVVVDETNNPTFGRKLTVDIYVTYNKSINEVQVYSRTEQLQG